MPLSPVQCSTQISLIYTEAPKITTNSPHFPPPWFEQGVLLQSLKKYPKITIVVPAHNEELVIQDTVTAILNLNYPKEQMDVEQLSTQK